MQADILLHDYELSLCFEWPITRRCFLIVIFKNDVRFWGFGLDPLPRSPQDSWFLPDLISKPATRYRCGLYLRQCLVK